jgi:phage gp16-like protein
MSRPARESLRLALAKVHVAKKRLGLDDGVYRAILKRVTGKESAAKLDAAELGRVLDEFKAMGFREGNSFTATLDDFTDQEPQARLIRALWADCVAHGVIRDASERALRRFVRRTARVDSIQWLGPREANAVIEGLKAMKARDAHKIKTQLEG